MTALCAGGGPSQAKPGFGSLVYMGPAAIGALMNNWPTPWAVAVAAYLGLITYDLTTFCPVDPPALPTLTAADYFALIQIQDPTSRLAAIAKFEDWIGARLWHELCECVSGAQPTPPAAPAQPVGWPTINPIVPTQQPCATFTHTGHTGVTAGTTYSAWLGTLTQPGTTSWRVSGINANLIGAGCSVQFQMAELVSGSFINTVLTDVFPAGVYHEFSGQLVHPTATYVQGNVIGVAGTGNADALLTLDLYCAGQQPGGPVLSCCPPDPTLQAQVDLILQMVTLIQRQSAPFAYVYGATYHGVTGHGSFGTSGLLGVAIHVDVLPPGTGYLDGSPVEYFDLGFVTLGTADGYSTSRRVDHDSCLLLPSSAGAFTAIGYTLNAGVEVSITELLREP